MKGALNIIDFVVRGEGRDWGLGRDQEGDQDRDRDQEEDHGKDQEGGYLMGSRAGTEGLVLDRLEFEDVGLGGVGEPDGSSVGKDGT